MTYEHVWNSFQYNLLSDDEYMKTADLLKLQDSDVIWEMILEAYRNTNRPFSKTPLAERSLLLSGGQKTTSHHCKHDIHEHVNSKGIRLFCLSLYDINNDIPASATSPNYLVIRVDCTTIYGLIKPVCKRVAASICYRIVRFTITIWWHHLHEFILTVELNGSRIVKYPIGPCCVHWNA